MRITAKPGNRPRLAIPCGWLAACTTLLACTNTLADWPTHRGSPQRTGCIDDQPGPAKPAIRWVHKAREDYVAAPLPEGSAVYFPALGPFNTGLFQCLTAQENLPRLLWTKTAPFLKRPVVCAPVTTDGLLIFGDGMHQTDDAILYCLMANTGRPVWQYPVPGKLVHLEAAPAIDRGRVYIGGGAAGVLCLDMKRVILDGQEMNLAASQAKVEEKWAELTAAATKGADKGLGYTATPNDDALPKPAPKLVWQVGKNAWHVDAPINIAGNSILVCSSFLDEEKIGKRALLCIRAADGATLWEVPLTNNPWAGATVAGNKVLVGCSNIRFDIDTIRQGTGEVVAVELTSGRVAWRKPVPGGILSPIAVKNNLAIFTATDGKVRAWNVDTGNEQWCYNAQHPFFAGPAVAADVVYAADLDAVLHALKLADGTPVWTFDVANAPGAQLPGKVYGSPVLHHGRIYLTTCNIQGSHVGEPSMVVCIADQQAPSPSTLLTLNATNRTLSIPCNIAPRKLPTLADIYPLEVIACFPAPLGQKAHETVVTTEVKPSELHTALVKLGLKPGSPGKTSLEQPTGAELRILLELPDAAGQLRTVPIEDLIIDSHTGRKLAPLRWFFTGSTSAQRSNGATNDTYGADFGGTLVTLFPVTTETVIQSTLPMKTRAVLNLDSNTERLPPVGTPIRLIIAANDTTPGPRAKPETIDDNTQPGFDPLRPFTWTRPVEPRQAQLPFVPSSIPEPSDTPALLRLDTPIPDTDTPIRPLAPRPKPELPVSTTP